MVIIGYFARWVRGGCEEAIKQIKTRGGFIYLKCERFALVSGAVRSWEFEYCLEREQRRSPEER